MSMPYMNEQSVVFTPADPDGNISDVPIFRAPRQATITSAGVLAENAVTGDDTDYITISIHELGNTSNVYANININSGVNVTANSWQNLTVNSNAYGPSKGTTAALTVTFNVAGNVNLGATEDAVIYQVDYVQGSPAAGG